MLLSDTHRRARMFWLRARMCAQYLPARTRARKCARKRALRAHLGQVPLGCALPTPMTAYRVVGFT